MSHHQNTDEITFAADQPGPTEEQQQPQEGKRFIDIHIYDDIPQDEQASIEGSITTPAEEPPHEQEETAVRQTKTTPFLLRRGAIVSICLGMLALLAIGTLVTLFVYPVLFPEATITIVPVSRQVQMTTAVTLTGATGAIPGRTLSAVTMSQEQAAPTTGRGHEDAQPGRGIVTFYNAAPSAQTIVAGTLLTGSDGIQVVTDQGVTVPAVAYPTLGQASVTAHTLTTGPAGNIQAGDIYGPCCVQNISAVNSAFSGGQAARDYQSVTQADISTVAASLKKSLDGSEQAALQTQVHGDETLVTPLPCQENVTSDRRPGDEATQVHVTVSETCSGVAYDTQAYQDDITQMLNQQATKQLGEGYTLIGLVQSNVTQVTADQQHITLHVTLAGTYDYQLSQSQQQAIKAVIAGKSKKDATAALLHTAGVQSVSITSTQGDALPRDSNRIHIQIILM
jgi:hypothetical protein